MDWILENLVECNVQEQFRKLKNTAKLLEILEYSEIFKNICNVPKLYHCAS